MPLSFPYELNPKCLSNQEIKIDGKDQPSGEKNVYRLSDGRIMILYVSYRYYKGEISQSEITDQRFYTLDELNDEKFGRRNFGKDYYMKWTGIDT